jgi:hypothetical protein
VTELPLIALTTISISKFLSRCAIAALHLTYVTSLYHICEPYMHTHYRIAALPGLGKDMVNTLGACTVYYGGPVGGNEMTVLHNVAQAQASTHTAIYYCSVIARIVACSVLVPASASLLLY